MVCCQTPSRGLAVGIQMSGLLSDNKERPGCRNQYECLFSDNKERPGCRDPDE